MISGFLLPLLLLGRFFWFFILALLVFTLIRRLFIRRQCVTYTHNAPFTHPGTAPMQPSAMEILRQRYARGEIDAVTFDQMRERLQASKE